MAIADQEIHDGCAVVHMSVPPRLDELGEERRCIGLLPAFRLESVVVEVERGHTWESVVLEACLTSSTLTRDAAWMIRG